MLIEANALPLSQTANVQYAQFKKAIPLKGTVHLIVGLMLTKLLK